MSPEQQSVDDITDDGKKRSTGYAESLEELQRINEEERGRIMREFAQLRADLNNKIDSLEQQVEGLQEQLQDVGADAELALSIAGRTKETAADGGPTKKQTAMRLSRDEVVRGTADGKNSGAKDLKTGEKTDLVGAVEVSDVQDMGKPQTRLNWQTVVDGWEELLLEWDCFEIREDPKELTVELPLSSELVRVVERSLGRDDLAKRLLDGAEGEGP
jgi:hypothetical protein